MKSDELKIRENLNQTLFPTIRNLARTLNPDTEISAPTTINTDLNFYHNPVFDIFTTKQPAPEITRFFETYLKHTPHRLRKIPQKLLISLIASPAAFHRTAIPSFSLSPRITDADHTAFTPGNKRIRSFNFKQNTIRTHIKASFPNTSIINEIKYRNLLSPEFPSVIPLLSADPHKKYFDEPLISAFPINRFPKDILKKHLPEIKRRRRDIAKSFSEETQARDYAEKLLHNINNTLISLQKKWPAFDINPIINTLQNIVASVINGNNARETVIINLSHGDFQPGNILLKPDKNYAFIYFIDWEDACPRFEHYDELVFNLNARAPLNLHKRLKRALRENIDPLYKIRILLFILEDWLFVTRNSADDALTGIPLSLRLHCRELNKIHDIITAN